MISYQRVTQIFNSIAVKCDAAGITLQEEQGNKGIHPTGVCEKNEIAKMCIWCESSCAQQFPLLERVRSKYKGNKEQIVARKIIDFTGTLLT